MNEPTTQTPQSAPVEVLTPAANTPSVDEFKRLLDIDHQPSVFQHPTMFAHAQRVAKMLVQSNMAPEHFKGEANLANAVIAVDIAFRLKVSPLLVMQQIYMVYGKPGFSSQFVVATINGSGLFSRLRFKITGEGDDRGCVAYAKELETDITLEGTRVDVAMAKKQGWWNKKDSKWPQMTDQMLSYRAASFWGRLYAPELLMGLQTVEELQDTLVEPLTKPLFPDKTKAVEEPKKVVGVTAQPPPPATDPTPREDSSLFAPITPAAAPQAPQEKPVPATTIEPAPAPEALPAPAEAPAPAPVVDPVPVKAPPGTPNPIRGVRQALATRGCKERDLIKFLADGGLVDPGLESLEAIALAQPEVFKLIFEQIDDLTKRLTK